MGRLTLTRRDLLKTGVGVATCAVAPSTPASAARRRDRPHILLLMADQFRGNCLHADGNAAIETPALDQIASEGIRFRCAYSSTPTCTPARTALLTGLSPWKHGMLGMTKMAEKYPIEMPQALRDAGYYTIGIGKMHFHPQRHTHGFHQTILDESSRVVSPEFRSDYRAWFASMAPTLDAQATGLTWNGYAARPYALPEDLHPTHWTGETAVRFIDGYNRPEPFFLKASFARPHSPYDPPERYWRMYESVDLPRASVGAWAQRYATPSGNDPDIWHGDLGPEQVRKSRQGYYGSVSFVDHEIGRILEALDKRGWLDDTLIVFTADHGDMTGDHNLWRKSYAYEASARIPMLMRWPTGLVDGRRGAVCANPVELRDILPTLLDAAHAAAPAAGADQLDGRSLLPLAAGHSDGWRPWIDLEHDICYSKENQWNALTDGKQKYIYHAMKGEEQLFDLDSDPGELQDLAAVPEHAEQLTLWRRRLVEHLSVRGEKFVKNGQLVPRPEGMMLSPNFPVSTREESK